MTERWSSSFFLLGTVLVVLVLWYLSYRVVRWDTRRRGMRSIECKAWIIAAVVLPLFGCALYLFVQVLQRYLAPPSETNEAASLNANIFDLRGPIEYPASDQAFRHSVGVMKQAPTPEPAWGSTQPVRSNGKASTYATPETARSPYQALRTRYSLVAIEGPLQGQQFLVVSLPLCIGRGEEAGIALDADLNISRKHAEIYEWNGMLRIRDLGSMHGVQVNGVASNDQALSPGDQITMGGTVLVLREIP